MSEQPSQSGPTIDIRKDVDSYEELQFSDGAVAFGWRNPGDRVTLGEFKYTSDLDSEGSPNVVILGLASGRRFALGRGVSVMLPEHSKETGRFLAQTERTAAHLEKIAPNGLPDVVIGEPWGVIDPTDPVADMVADYRTDARRLSGAHQLDYPSPFPHVREILQEVQDKMRATGYIQ